MAIELTVYKPMRRRVATPLVLLLSSLGIYIVLQNIISMAFGDDTKTLRSGVVTEGLQLIGARITPIQIGIIVTSLCLLVLVWYLMRCLRTLSERCHGP